MAGLFNSVMYGAEKIPDSWFHKIPGGYYRPKEDKDKDKKKKKKKKSGRHSHRRSEADRNYDDEDDYYVSDDYEGRHGGRNRLADYEDDGFEGDYHGGRARGKSVDAARTFDEPRYRGPAPAGPSRREKPYDPADLASESAVEREYYDSRPYDLRGDSTRLVSPVAAGVAAAHYVDSQQRPTSSYSGPAPGYVPYADIYGTENQQPRTTKLQRDAERHPHNSEYEQPRSAHDPYYRAPYVSDYRSTTDSPQSVHSGERRHHRQHHGDSSRKRHKSRNRSRARSSVRDRFDTSDKGLGYGTMGAVAGGLLGNEAGRGGVIPTVAGAVIGGLGANAYENRDKQKRGSRQGNKYDDRYDDPYEDDSHASRRRSGHHGSHRSSRRSHHGYHGYYSD
ncbi:hypothetical protein AAFC00_003673 [Neodothiora populina]|uniref:Glycine zipper 2TM domain-containing protein n=1 Tax=Neodothiora populina TaxID=2781224 RepID=A0ABR3PEZ1_9PEZI